MVRQRNNRSESGHVQRWLMPYADMITVLFVVILALQQVPATTSNNVQTVQQSTTPKQPHSNTPFLSPRDKQQLKQSHVGWQMVGSTIQLTFPGVLLFSPNQTTLSSQGETLLRRLSGVISQCRGTLRVEGHTDANPTIDKVRTNRVLSAERAARVADFLTEQLGLDPRQITAVGLGATQPILSNATEIGRQQNRRVVIIMTDP